MNRIEFMKELEYLLQDLTEEDRAEALIYYRDYLEEAGDEHEEEAIREFGSPERVAAIIRSDLAGNLSDGGEFTESGYQDERFKDPNFQLVERRELPEAQSAADGAQTYEKTDKAHRQDQQDRTWLKRLIKVGLLLIVLGVLGPIALGIGGGVLGMAAGILCLFVGAVICIGVLTITAWIGAVTLLVFGAGLLTANPGAGVLMLGLGVLVLGLALIGVAVSALVYGTFIPFGIRSIVNGISGVLHRGRRKQA